MRALFFSSDRPRTITAAAPKRASHAPFGVPPFDPNVILDILRHWRRLNRQMIFIENDGFQRRCKGLLDDEELGALMDWLAAQPGAGDLFLVDRG